MAGRAPKVAGRAPAPAGRRFAIVAARFNEPITKRLVDGAVAAFRAGGVAEHAIDVWWVPGSFELPQAAAHLVATGRYAGVACLGVVIRGQTPHFEHITREAATGIREVALRSGVPTTFGVITALTEEQAWDRAGGEVGNRGEEAAAAALEMSHLIATLRKKSTPKSARQRRRRSGRR
jgi:6,7-dimethyl-8-ribityllumazine synthase